MQGFDKLNPSGCGVDSKEFPPLTLSSSKGVFVYGHSDTCARGNLRRAIIGILLIASSTRAAMDPAQVHRLLALLRGVEQEYREAFDDAGKLVRPFELEEAELLLAEARDLGRQLSGPADLGRRLESVAEAFHARATVDVFSTRVRELRAALQDATGVREDVSPPEPPFASRGARLFKEHCVSCHGEQGKGDGPDAARSEPRPPDFTDPAFMRAETPADFFSVISLGRRRAVMPGWEDVLSVQQRWDLVSYLWSLREVFRRVEDGQHLFIVHCASCHAAAAAPVSDGSSKPQAAPLTALDRMATRSDAELYAAITDGKTEMGMSGFQMLLPDEERWKLVAFVRTLSLGGAASTESNAAADASHLERSLALVAQQVAAAVDAYRLREDGATGLAAGAYLVFEPLEPAIAAHDASAVDRVEKEFVRLQRALRQPDAVREVDDAAGAVTRALDAAKQACRPSLSERTRARSAALPLAAAAAMLGILVLIGVRRRRH